MEDDEEAAPRFGEGPLLPAGPPEPALLFALHDACWGCELEDREKEKPELGLDVMAMVPELEAVEAVVTEELMLLG